MGRSGWQKYERRERELRRRPENVAPLQRGRGNRGGRGAPGRGSGHLQ